MEAMKKLILLLVTVTCTISVFAQRVNEHGLKMVSEIECSYDNDSYLFKFKYDENSRLVRMSVYKEGKLYRDFVKTAEGLTVKDYDTYNYSPLRWETSFDTYGNISSIAVFEEFQPGAIKRDVFNFFYERDKDSNTSRLTKYDHTETSKRKGQKSWYGTTCGTSCEEVFYKDGFIIGHDYSNTPIDYNHINDTNINLLRFFSCTVNGGGNLAYFDLTEWLPCRSKYFIDRSIRLEDYIRYDYKYDQNNNLVQISEIRNGKYNKSGKDYCEQKVTGKPKPECPQRPG